MRATLKGSELTLTVLSVAGNMVTVRWSDTETRVYSIRYLTIL